MQEEYEIRFNDIKYTNILEEVIKLYNPKVVGEEDNIKLLWCACISKDLPNKYRMSVIITSQSSAGKSNLTNSVLEPFNDDVLEFTDYTQAYLQRTEWNMNGKILKMEQMERTNEKRQISLGKLKFMLSEGVLKIGLVEKNDKGKNEPKMFEVRGIPVFISTSTNYNIDPETLNRTFLMQVDETEEQTKKIIDYVLDDYSTLSINDKWLKNKEKLKEYAKTYKEFAHQITDILVPFKAKIKEIIPTSDITMRRDLAKILNLTCVIAFLNFPNRTLIANNDGQHFLTSVWGDTEKRYTYALIAEASDFELALRIGGETIDQTINKVNKASKDLLDRFKKIEAEHLEGVTVSMVAKEIQKSDNRTRELLEQLRNSGFLTREREGKGYRYSSTQKKFENISLKEFEFTKEELDQYIQSQIGEYKDKFTVVNVKS